MTFVKDLKDGMDGEHIVSELLTPCGITCNTNDNTKKRSEFDLACKFPKGDLSFTIEVKYDIYAAKSGNIAIEVYNPRTCKPSGLMITQADLWIQIADGGVYCVGREILKHYVGCHTPKKVIERTGDGNATIYLYRMMPEVFVRLDTLDTVSRLAKIIQTLGKHNG